jgi:hypothetical protein
MWSSRKFLANVKAEDGKYLSASLGYRGAQLSSQEIDDQVQPLINHWDLVYILNACNGYLHSSTLTLFLSITRR